MFFAFFIFHFSFIMAKMSFNVPAVFAEMVLSCKTSFCVGGTGVVQWFRTDEDLVTAFELFMNMRRHDKRSPGEVLQDVIMLEQCLSGANSISEVHKKRARDIRNFALKYKVRSPTQTADELWLRLCLEWHGYAECLEGLNWPDVGEIDDMGPHPDSDDEE